MQTCTRCHSQSPDSTRSCLSCGADLQQYSVTAVALKKFQDNPRVLNIRLVVAHDACPTCAEMEGTYEKFSAPSLPVEGCSCPTGCRCFYEPMLEEIYP